MAKPHEDPRVLFWRRVDKSGACWTWTGGKDKDGYGKFQITLPRDGLPRGAPSRQRHVRAHVFAWEIDNGRTPAGMVVMHSCDNPSCVRPDHLSIGTQKANREDCVKKGRQARGSTSGCAKMSEESVRELRAAHARGDGSIKALATRFGISHPQACAIITKREWRHVDGQA